MSRHWLLIPDLFPHSVVSFHFRDDPRKPGRSWRIRDYSGGTRVEYGPTHIDLDHDEILAQAIIDEPALVIQVDEPYWHRETAKLNERYAHLLAPDARPMRREGVVPRPPPTFPVLDEDKLRGQRSGIALDRILYSPNSEDWVTWTTFRLLGRVEGWWPRFLELSGLDLDPNDIPTLEFWRVVPSPPLYEAALRERMRSSGHAAQRDRARNPKPVEGPTEVDLVLEGKTFLWFCPATIRAPHRRRLDLPT